jgi:hypothetical protein
VRFGERACGAAVSRELLEQTRLGGRATPVRRPRTPDPCVVRRRRYRLRSGAHGAATGFGARASRPTPPWRASPPRAKPRRASVSARTARLSRASCLNKPGLGARHAGAHQLRGPAAPPPAVRFSGSVWGRALGRLTIGCSGCGAGHTFERTKGLRDGPAPTDPWGVRRRRDKLRCGAHGAATGLGARASRLTPPQRESPPRTRSQRPLASARAARLSRASR